MKTVTAVVGKCRECSSDVKFELDEKTPTIEVLKNKETSFNCPGGGLTPHVRLGSFRVGDKYDFEGAEIGEVKKPDDADVIAEVKRRAEENGWKIFANSKELGFPSFDDVPGKKHVFGGEFEGPSGEYYERHDLPSGRRLYIERK